MSFIYGDAGYNAEGSPTIAYVDPEIFLGIRQKITTSTDLSDLQREILTIAYFSFDNRPATLEEIAREYQEKFAKRIEIKTIKKVRDDGLGILSGRIPAMHKKETQPIIALEKKHFRKCF